MNTLQVTRDNALKAYREADERGQALLKTLFGGSLFHANMKDWEDYIIPLLTDFSAACQVTGDNPEDDELNSGTVDEIAYKQVKIFTRAFNPPDWKPNYTDGSQRKWYVWFEFIPGSGFRFDGSVYGIKFTYSAGGSRLCFASEKLAIAAAKNPEFLAIYNRYLQ